MKYLKIFIFSNLNLTEFVKLFFLFILDPFPGDNKNCFEPLRSMVGGGGLA